MITISRTIGGVRVRAACGEAHRTLAESVLAMLERMSASDPLRPGLRVRFGWSLLTLARTDDGLVVCEPDFSGNPLAGTRPQIETTLDVVACQTALVRRLGVEPVDAGFEQYVVFERDALVAHGVALFRAQSPDSDDSGWSLSVPDRAGEVREEDFEAVPVYRFLELRPSVLTALALPPGLLVTMEGDRVVSVLDQSGRDRLRARV